MRSSSDYIQEDHDAVESLTWDSDGVRFGTASATWDQVFGVVSEGRKVYVLVPRQPPRPPWIEVTGLSKDARARFETALQHQKDSVSYRTSRHASPPRSPAQLLELVRARQPVPGLLEIPYRTSSAPLWVGGAVLTSFLPAVFDRWSGMVLLAVFLLLVLASAAREVLMHWHWFTSNRKRVLVLCPDGCVLGVRGGPRAFSWSEVGKFERLGSAIVLRDTKGAHLVALQSSYFGAPLSLVCTVAESYRQRYQRAQGFAVRVAASGEVEFEPGVLSAAEHARETGAPE